MNIKRIVTIGGGTGHFTLLSGLKEYPFDIKAIVSMADHGGSTGKLRDELGVLPPGDIKQCLVALSSSPKILRDLFLYRFKAGSLKGHSFGNLFLSALEKSTGKFERAVEEASKILTVKGEVIPATLDKIELKVVLEDGKLVAGEDKIEKLKSKKVKIEKAYLQPKGQLNPKAREAIKKAGAIIFGPGDLYTSIIPNLLIKGMKETLKKSKAKKIFVINLMNKFGQTRGFSTYDYLREIEKYSYKGMIGTAIYNTKKPARKLLEKYKKEGEFVNFVEPPKGCRTKFLGFNLLSQKEFRKKSGDKIKRSFIRHNPRKLARAIIETI